MGCTSCGTVNLVTIEPGQEATTVAVKDGRAPVARFFAERVEVAAGQRVQSDEMFAVYATWAAEKGGTAPAPQTFGRALSELMGVERYRSNGKRYYLNVALRD